MTPLKAVAIGITEAIALDPTFGMREAMILRFPTMATSRPYRERVANAALDALCKLVTEMLPADANPKGGCVSISDDEVRELVNKALEQAQKTIGADPSVN